MMIEGKPFTGRILGNLKIFLKRMGLEYDERIEYSVCVLDDDYNIIGTGSVDGNVLKCIAIEPEYQGQGFSATIISQLIEYEYECGRTHIFIYTKPENRDMFVDMGFYVVLQTENILFMENQVHEFENYWKQIRSETPDKALEDGITVGAVVANCNPFTLGHRYLIEEALKWCDYLHLFILSEDKSEFDANVRYEMVKLGVEDLPGVICHRTSDYIISAATFPTYFFKDKEVAKKANCRLDLELFARKIAPQLNIKYRFVGTEPYCGVTASYNQLMKEILPQYGIMVEEIERKGIDGKGISASEVRKLVKLGKYQAVKKLVPREVYLYLQNIEMGGQ